KAVYNLATM
nr:Chain C, Glycoprotein 9-residue peptide [synthetic construct]1S7R_F Chain F, Glycoprotein 9-residue peptide [synthetic construct]1S7V_C Chain C, Glycoprotein 9-residue peptide [synthetic construct]1S7V_F Chain F, Glycoprotein 9-residue peptide [synthetic construct]